MAEGVQTSDEIIKLSSSDGQVFDVPKKVAFLSKTVEQMVSEVESQAAGDVIPLTNVSSTILAKVIEYCKHQLQETPRTSDFLEAEADDAADEDAEEEDFDIDGDSSRKKKANKLTPFEQEFISVEQPVLFDLMLAANYLNVQSLLEFLIQHVASMIVACKDAAEIREKFNIPNDLSEEEVEEIKKRHTWAFD